MHCEILFMEIVMGTHIHFPECGTMERDCFFWNWARHDSFFSKRLHQKGIFLCGLPDSKGGEAMKALIFDFDGTIVDTESLWYEVYNDFFREHYGFEVPVDVFARGIGSGDFDIFYELEKVFTIKLDYHAISKQLHALFEDRVDSLIVRPGVMEIVKMADANGWPLAIATSSSRSYLYYFLQKFHLDSYFTVLNTKDDVQYVKPHPELYLKTVAELGVEHVVAIEDSYNGAKAATTAGLTCYVVPNKVTTHSAFPEGAIVLQDFPELLEKIKEG